MGSEMPDDYEQAAVRHYVDADSLAAIGRFDNAGHLIGFSAECALKKKIRALHKDQTRTVDGHHRAPLHEIRLLLEKSRMGGRWLALCNSRTYLSGWDIGQRYGSDGTVSEEQFRSWQKQAADVIALAGIQLRKNSTLSTNEIKDAKNSV